MTEKIGSNHQMPDVLHPDVLSILNKHLNLVVSLNPFTVKYKHGFFIPSTKSFTELLGSAITQIPGHEGDVPTGGGDLADGSDVKGLYALGANDTPRWDGVFHTGNNTYRPKNKQGGYDEGSMYTTDEFDMTPYLILCAWHEIDRVPTFSVWIIRGSDPEFRKMAQALANLYNGGEITGNVQFFAPDNGQIWRTRVYRMHEGLNIVRSNGFYLQVPLLFRATWESEEWTETNWNPSAVEKSCVILSSPDDKEPPPYCDCLLTAPEVAEQLSVSVEEVKKKQSQARYGDTHYWIKGLLK